MQINSILPKYVEFIPEDLEEGVIYISKTYNTAVHLCCCGCKNEVVTPLKPMDWRLYEHRNSISLSPSIGNWSFECKSHYWIKKNQILLANQWSDEMIQAGRKNDLLRKQQYYESNKTRIHRITVAINKILKVIKHWWLELF